MYLHEELNSKHAKQGNCKEVDDLRPRHLFRQRKLFALPKKFCIPKKKADTDIIISYTANLQTNSKHIVSF